MAIPRTYRRTGHIGGTSDDLDAISATDLDSSSMAIVLDLTNLVVDFYRLNPSSGQAENSPRIIRPDDETGDKRWERIASIGTSIWEDFSPQNLLINHDMSSWSAGTSSLPDDWSVQNATMAKITGGGEQFGAIARFTGSGAGYANLSKTITTLIDPNKPVTLIARVRSASGNSLSHTVVIWTDVGASSVLIPNDSSFHTLKITRTLGDSPSVIQARPIASPQYSTEVVDIDWCIVFQGDRWLSQFENPLNRALKAIHYQDATPVNYEYRGLRIETGTAAASAVVVFQQQFRKLLCVVPLNATGKSTTGFTMPATASDWLAIGVN